MQAIQTNHQELELLQNTTNLKFNMLSTYSSQLSIIMSEYSRMSAIVGREMERLHNSIMDLMEGKLSLFLFSVTSLGDILENIQHHLTLLHTQFSVAILDPRYYYQHAKFLVHRQNNDIFVMLKTTGWNVGPDAGPAQ